MKKALLFIIAMLTATVSVMAQHNHINVTNLPQLEVSKGQSVSGAFAGIVGGQLTMAGGCNFPKTPAAEGGEKVYYNTIYTLKGNKEWTTMAITLPSPLAYGASVSVGEGIVMIGGTDGEKPETSGRGVWLLTQAGITALPKLPYPISNHSATIHGSTIYVAGGESLGQPNKQVLSLEYPEGKEWTIVGEMPGRGRLQPCVAVQTGALHASLYIMGGYELGNDSISCEVHTNGACLNLTTQQWTTTAPMPTGTTLVGAQAVTSGYSHIVCLGGVDKTIFETRINQQYLQHKYQQEIEQCLMQGDSTSMACAKSLQASLDKEIDDDKQYMYRSPEWYHFRTQPLVYHTITDTWTTAEGDSLLARAGATLVDTGNGWTLVGGETKPGIRGTTNAHVKLASATSFGWINWTVLVAYLLSMLGLGYYFMRRESGADDFFKGGGRIPWWAAGISIYATMLSAITYMAIPAKAYATDWTYYPMLITILVVSFPVIKYYLPFFRRLKVTSAYEYLEYRFNISTRLMASMLFIIFMIARMALVLYLPSLALTAVTGIDIRLCIVLMSIVTIVYCTMGGVEAVVWGDVVQGIILVGGAIFAVIFLAVETEGGISGCINLALEDDKLRLFNWSLNWQEATFWVVIIGGMANNLISYTSDQTVIQRYLTTKDERSAGQSILLNGVMSAFVSVAFYAIGTGLYTFFKTHPEQLDFSMQKGDAILPYFMMSQMPVGLAGLLIAAIFAATMSTISSNINSVATAFSVDFYKRFRQSATDHQVLRVARTTCVVSGVIGMAIALLMTTWNILSLLDYFNTILGLLSSGLGGLFVMGIFFKRIDGRSALIGFVAGTAAVFALNFMSDVNFLLYGAIGMVISVIVALLCSLLLRNKKDMTGLVFEGK